MSFRLRVTFTGIVGFVRNSKEGAYPPMCALLVDGSQSRRALDGTTLCRHRSFLRFPIDNVAGSAGSAESFGLWYLDGQRVYFDVLEEGSDSQGLTLRELRLEGIPHPEEPDLRDALNRESLTWMLNMSRIFPGFRLDARTLEASPPREANVGAQIVIDRGIFSTKSFTPVVWECDQTLSGRLYRQVFSHEVDLCIHSLISAQVVAVSFDDPGQRRVLELTSLPRNTAGEVEIQILNVCDQNPLQWSPPAQPRPDEDTKWFFELLDPSLKDDLRRRLGVAELPIPRPLREFNSGGIGAPGTGNCIPPDLVSTDFSLPALRKPGAEH